MYWTVKPMKKCKSHSQYQGLKPPTCNDGRGCEACNVKWSGAQRRRERGISEEPVKELAR